MTDQRETITCPSCSHAWAAHALAGECEECVGIGSGDGIECGCRACKHHPWMRDPGARRCAECVRDREARDLRIELDVARAERDELHALIQRTHGVHADWVRQATLSMERAMRLADVERERDEALSGESHAVVEGQRFAAQLEAIDKAFRAFDHRYGSMCRGTAEYDALVELLIGYLACDHCGGEARGRVDVGDGDGPECEACGFPGHVSMDAESEPYWVASEDPDAKCKDKDCEECR